MSLLLEMQQSPLSDFTGEVIVFVVTVFLAWLKKRKDIRKIKRDGLPRRH